MTERPTEPLEEQQEAAAEPQMSADEPPRTPSPRAKRVRFPAAHYRRRDRERFRYF